MDSFHTEIDVRIIRLWRDGRFLSFFLLHPRFEKSESVRTYHVYSQYLCIANTVKLTDSCLFSAIVCYFIDLLSLYINCSYCIWCHKCSFSMVLHTRVQWSGSTNTPYVAIEYDFERVKKVNIKLQFVHVLLDIHMFLLPCKWWLIVYKPYSLDFYAALI